MPYRGSVGLADVPTTLKVGASYFKDDVWASSQACSMAPALLCPTNVHSLTLRNVGTLLVRCLLFLPFVYTFATGNVNVNVLPKPSLLSHHMFPS